MSLSADEPEPFQQFRRWAQENGGYIHEALCFQSSASDRNVRRVKYNRQIRVDLARAEPTRSVIAGKAIPTDTCILSCPFDLAITRDLAVGAVKACVWDATQLPDSKSPSDLPERIDRLNERQIVCAYIGLHWILVDDEVSKRHLRHAPYLDSLPEPSTLLTPLHFTPAELALLNGTNMLGACLDRRKEWEAEWRTVRDIMTDAVHAWGEAFTWDRYLTAATYLSSRAFPSSLLTPDPTKTMTQDKSSYPVLLPILDCLNHARGQPVSWVVTSSPPRSTPPPISDGDTERGNSDHSNTNANSSSLHITLHLRCPTPTQAEVFNNYGPKPNSELLLGYGFVLPSNPEDTIVLKLGGSTERHEIGRHAARHAESGGMKSLWDEIETMVLNSGEDDVSVTSMEGGWEVTLEVCEALDEMITQKIDALPDLSETPAPSSATIRPEVRAMIAEYVKGQQEVLEGILDYVDIRKRAAIERARASGLDVQEVFDDDD